MAENEAPARPLPSSIGPGAIENVGPEYEPALQGATRDELVTILNPLTVDFVAKVGVTKTAMMPVRINNPQNFPTRTESDLAAKGIGGFRNPDLGGGRVNISNEVMIKSGETIKQPGDVASVIVKQLITAICQVRGLNIKIADPDTRRNIEKEVIIGRRAMSELFGAGGPISVDDQLKEAVKQANQQSLEPIFPEVTQPDAKRGPGRPAKGDNGTT